MAHVVTAAAAYPSTPQPVYGTFVEGDQRQRTLDDRIEEAVRAHRERVAYYRRQNAEVTLSLANSEGSLSSASVPSPDPPEQKISLWTSFGAACAAKTRQRSGP